MTLFNRPPRVPLPSLQDAHIDLSAPPPITGGQETSWLAALVPLLGVGTMGLVYVFRTGDALLALPMLAVACAALIGALAAARMRRRGSLRARAEAEVNYLRLLDAARARLRAANDAQIGVLERHFPTPGDLLTIALDHDTRLWNRRPTDSDFGAFRIGSGRVPSQVTINLPEGDQPELQPARALAEAYRFLEPAPVTVSLRAGSAGLCGYRPAILRAARAAICHLAVTHTPDELLLYFTGDERHVDEWRWLEWLPHAENHLAYDAEDLRTLNSDLTALLEERRQRAAHTATANTPPPTPLIVLIVDAAGADADAIKREAAYTAILREGAALGAAVLAIAPTFDQLPGECANVIEIGANDGAGFRVFTAGANAPAETILRGAVLDTMPARDAEHIARALAGIAPAATGQNRDLPDRVNLLALYNVGRADDLTGLLRTKWGRAAPDGVLPFPFPIGMESSVSALELRLDDAHHGAHGVLAGTTGSGKSELLAALICALAIEHDPRLVNFLLIDFKGGSAFHHFAALPHTVGMVTNLDGALIARTLAALKAETDWRQAFLKRMGVRDITQYHRAFTDDHRRLDDVNTVPLPHLFILVDEFAQLAKEMPDFMRELVRTAQVGRGLGLHLILGTQSPMDVITDEMNANMQFRLCLRVANVESSRAVLRRPDAAYIPAGFVGRGYFQVGDGGAFKAFQTAYVGGDYDRDARAPTRRDPYGALELITATGKSINLRPPLMHMPPGGTGSTYTTAHAIADTITDYARAEGIPPARPILLPPLKERITLHDVYDSIGAGGWNGASWFGAGRDHEGRPIPTGSAPIGLIDDLENRVQHPLWVHLRAGDSETAVGRIYQRDGHVLIVGAPGTGKTALLRTLALSEALLHAPDKLHLYALSFTGSGLDDVGRLPHAESTIHGTEGERVRRLFARLIRLLDQRQADQTPGEAPIPLVLVLIDQYEGLRDLMRDNLKLSGDFERLITEGRTAGILLALTASSADALPERLRGLIRQRIALNLGDPVHYLNVIGRAPALENAPPGRGYLYASPPLACQIALPSDQPVSTHIERAARALPAALYTSVNPSAATLEAVVIERMNAVFDSMRAAYHTSRGLEHAPTAIRTLPRRLPLVDLLYAADAGDPAGTLALAPVIGRWDDDPLTPYRHDLIAAGGVGLVIGAPGTGKTNLLLTAALSLAYAAPPEHMRLILADADQRQWAIMRDLPHTLAVSGDAAAQTAGRDAKELAHITARLRADLDLPANNTHTAVFFDHFDSLVDLLRHTPDALNEWRDLLRRHGGRRLSIWVAAYGDRSNDPLMRFMLMRRGGFALGGRDALTRLNIRASGLPVEPLPVGRAYVPLDDGIGVMQTALVDDLHGMIAHIRRRWDAHPRAAWLTSTEKAYATPAPVVRPPLDESVTDIDVRGLIQDLTGKTS